jgi:hypothetical protein
VNMMKRKSMTEEELNWLAGLLVDKMLTLLGHRIAGYDDRPVIPTLADIGHRVTMRSALPQVTFSKMEKRGRGKMTEKQMRCRHPRCKARSRGPRFHYLCKKHYRG